MRRYLIVVRDFLLAHWTVVALILFMLVLHWDLLTWAVPATGDHMIHMYKVWLMSEHLLPTGRITGWSNMAFAGYPAGVYYPVLGDILLAVGRYITFDLFSFERVYAVFFMILLLAIPLVVYAFTRRFAGRFGAFVAGLLMAGDVGGWPQGGYVSTVHWAVWPFILGLMLSMLAVLACDKVILKPMRSHPLRYLGFTALLAVTVLAHPMSAFFLGLSAPTFVILTAIVERKNVNPARTLGRAALPAAVALIMVLFWVVPWMTTGREWTLGWPAVGFGGMWLSLGRSLERLAQNKLFYDFYWVTWILGGAGFVLALVSRKRWPVYVAGLLILAFLFVGFAHSQGDGLMARKVQIERMAAFMKFLWFILAGYAADRAGFGLRWAVEKLPERFGHGLWKKVSRIGGQVLPVAVAVAIVVVGWSDNYSKTARLGRLGGDIWDDIVEAEGWIAQQPRGALDRVLHQPGKMCVSGNLVSEKCNEVYHRHIFASSPVHTDLPKLKFGYEATAIFKNVPLAHRWPYDTELIQRLILRPEAMESLHVRWIVSLVEWPDRDDIELVKQFGKVWVYAVKPGMAPPVRLEGSGSLKVIAFEDERVVVEVKGAGEGSRILYPVAYFYPWRAYRDGEEIPLGRHGVLPNVREILMAVDARDGVTELLYVRPWWERACNWASLVFWVLVLGAGAIVISRRAIQRSRNKA